MTRYIEGELLKLGFYFGDLSERRALAQLVHELVKLGARFTGEGHAHRRPNIGEKPFASKFEERPELIMIKDELALTQHLADMDTRVMAVLMEGATGALEDVAEVITYEGISAEASRIDRHPLQIWTEGWLFSGTVRQEQAGCARKTGLQIYQRFCALVEALQPDYAAIMADSDSLGCPTDLHRDPNTYAFRDFFVNGNFLGSSKLDQVEKMFPGAYVEQIGNGVYISTMAEFNPEGRSWNAERALWQSVEVAKLIAQRG